MGDLAKFSERKLSSEKKSKSNSGDFKGNVNGNACEVLAFDVELLPLLPGFDAEKFEKESKEKENENETEKGWSSWASARPWSEWGASMVSASAWTNSVSSWMKYLNMNLRAREVWKIDWIQLKCTSVVTNSTMSMVVGVYEYAEIEQLMHIKKGDDSEEKNENEKAAVKCRFIKKLFVHPIVPIPGFALELLKKQYREYSELQMDIVRNLCEKPLNADLQQLDDV